jgi:hypothetical protein
MEITSEEVNQLKDILKIECDYGCDKFNRYCSNDCTCGGEYKKLVTLEEFAENLIIKFEGQQ